MEKTGIANYSSFLGWSRLEKGIPMDVITRGSQQTYSGVLSNFRHGDK